LNPANFVYEISTSKTSVPGSLNKIKIFVQNYLKDTEGVQSIFEFGRNMMTLEILKIIKFMLNHGFFNNLKELKEVSAPMINLLNGSNDIYYDKTEQKSLSDEAKSNIEDFVSVKRYFCSGNNDIIVQCKTIVC